MYLNVFGVVLLSFLLEALALPKHAPCPTIKLKNGKVRYRQKNRFVKFTCNSGYLLAGERYSTCDNGQWDGLIPKCVRSSCTKVNPPANALIYPSHRGGVLNFFCKPGYALRGLNATYCDGMNWDNKLPSCIESNTLPKLQCDFESEDLCGWNHDLRHDFDWKRKNLTGESGHYMYIESSYRNLNDTARLISPIYDPMNDTEVCFEFYFQIYGDSAGQLRGYLKKESRDWRLQPSGAFFWKSGNHGRHWVRSRTLLGPVDEDFQIVIEGVRGSTYASEIAIDDVSIIPNCTLEEVTTERDIEYTWEEEEQSCLNRCDTYNSSAICDCDDNCIDNNRCCLDYVATCVLGTEEYGSTTVSSSVFETTEDTRLITTVNFVPSRKETTTTTTSTTPTPTTKTTSKPTLKITTKPTTRTTPKPTLKVTTQPTTRPTLKPTVRTTPKPTVKMTTKLTTRTTSKPTVKLTTKPTIKTTPKSTVRTTPKPTVKPTTKPTTTLAPTRRQTTKKVIPKTTTISIFGPIDEIITLPTLPEDDSTPIGPLFTSHVNQTPLDANDAEEPFASRRIVIVVVVAVSAATLATVMAIVVMRRRRLFDCGLRKMKSSGSDSQSDVRFLTSDEILNFNLAYCDD